jgi:oligoribonuclease NrnB/cAMP/cGMP phosphodiesterase (DHH superfamily)
MKENGLNYELRPHNYDLVLDMNGVTKEDKLYFLDVVSQPYSIMQNLLDDGYDVTICDHHASFLNTKIHESAKGLCSTSFSGCELTWKFFFEDKEMPTFVRYLGRYDIWDKSNLMSWNSTYLPFQYGLRTFNTKPLVNKDVWESLFSGDVVFIENIINTGHKILSYTKKTNAESAEVNSFEAKLAGYDYNFICMNTNHRSSAALEAVYNPIKHDGMLVFSYGPKGWGGSIYTTKDIDMSLIAVSLGGGGHKQACGFPIAGFTHENGVITLIKK